MAESTRPPPPPPPDVRALLLSLCGSLTLCDHQGDVLGDVEHVLKALGIEVDDEGEDDYGRAVRRALHALGVQTLYGTPLADDP